MIIRVEKESDHSGEDQSGAMQRQVHSIEAVQKPWKSNTSARCPCRYATITATDAKCTEYQSGEHREAFSGADDAEDAERTKGTPGSQETSQQTQSTRESQCRVKQLERRECRQREDSR